MSNDKLFSEKLQDLLNKYFSIKPDLQKTEILLNNENCMYKIIVSSILNDLILSKTLFKRNSMVAEFLVIYFNISLTKTSINSRTIICGKITRYILGIDDEDELTSLLNIIYKVILKIEKNEDLFQKDLHDVIRGINLE